VPRQVQEIASETYQGFQPLPRASAADAEVVLTPAAGGVGSVRIGTTSFRGVPMGSDAPRAVSSGESVRTSLQKLYTGSHRSRFRFRADNSDRTAHQTHPSASHHATGSEDAGIIILIIKVLTQNLCLQYISEFVLTIVQIGGRNEGVVVDLSRNPN